MSSEVDVASNSVTTMSYDFDAEAPNTPSVLPEPSGFKLLVALPRVKSKTEGGIYIPEERQLSEQVASIVGCVLKMGSDCYQDEKRFPNGPWCKVGDWVLMRAYAGSRIMVHGEEFRLINDDSVEATVDDPRGVFRAGR